MSSSTVGVGQERVVGPGTEGAGGVQGGVQAEFLAAVEHLGGEGVLKQRFSSGQGHSPARQVGEPPVPFDALQYVVHGGGLPVAQVPGVRVGAVQAAQRTAAQEEDDRVPGPSTPVDRSQEWIRPVVVIVHRGTCG